MGKVSDGESVVRGKYHIGKVSYGESVISGKCRRGRVSYGEVSYRESVIWE